MKKIGMIIALACCCANGWAAGTVVANYRTDYKTASPLTSGWQYLWNAPSGWTASGASGDLRSSYLGIPGDYVALADAGTTWTPDGDTNGANNNPGSYLKLTATGGHPGAVGNETSSWDRYAIAAFTVPSSGFYTIENSFLSKPSATGDGVEVLVFPGVSGAILRQTAPPAGSVDFNIEIGYLKAGMTIYVAFGATGSPASDSFEMDFDIVLYPRTDIYTQITSAVAQGSSVVTVLPGRYYSNRGNTHHIFYEPIQNLTIHAENVELVCQTPYRALTLTEFNNVTISGLTVDYDPSVFFQGTIESVGSTYLDVRMHKGYPLPTPSTISSGGVIYESTGDLPVKRGSWTPYASGMEQLEADLVRFNGISANAGAAVGDYYLIKGSAKVPHGIVMTSCVDTTLESVTLHGATSFGIYSTGGGGQTFNNVHVVPGATPLLASVKPLLSSNADGIDVSASAGNLTITNCRVEYAGDDSIVASSTFGAIIGKPAPNVLTVAFHSSKTYSPGDWLKIYTRAIQQREDRDLVSQATSSLSSVAVKALTDQYFPSARFGSSVKAYDLTLDAAVDAVPGDYLSNADQSCRNFLIANNIVKNTRARGILVKASEGTVANNVVENTLLGGIQLRPDPVTWFSGDWAADVNIISNRLNRCAIGGRSISSAGGSIVISSTETSWSAYGHQNLLLADNIISNAPGCAIYMKYAANVELRDNLICNSHEWVYDTSAVNQSVVRLDTVENISFTGTNWVYNLGPLADPNKLIRYESAVGLVTGQLYRPEDLTIPAIIAYWDLDDGTGSTAADVSGNGFDGTLVNGPTWTAGHMDGALQFDGVNDRVDIGNLNTKADTVALWAYFPVDITAASSRSVLMRYGTEAQQHVIGLGSITGFAADETLTILAPFTTGYQRTYIRDTITAGWHFLAFVWDATKSQYRIMIDNEDMTVYTSSSGLDAPKMQASMVSLGASDGSGYAAFNGALDDVRVFNFSLSNQQLENIYNDDTTPPSAPSNLVAVAGDSFVSLDWNNNTEPDLVSYNVYRSTTSGSYGAALATGVSASDYVDNTAVNDTTYYYVVKALDVSNNESGDSNEDSALPVAPMRPTFDDRVMARNPQYVAWKADYNLVQGADGNDDGDQLNNFVEFALGGNPTNSADIGTAPTIGTTAGGFEYVHVQRKGTPVAYSLELTGDLASGVWINSGYSVLSTNTLDADFDIVTNQIPDLGKTNQFIRLMIEQL